MPPKVISFSEEDEQICRAFCDEVADVLHQVAVQTACLKIFADQAMMQKSEDENVNKDESASSDAIDQGMAKASLLAMFTKHDIMGMLSKPTSRASSTTSYSSTSTAEGGRYKRRSSLVAGMNVSSAAMDSIASWNCDLFALNYREMYAFVLHVFRSYKLFELFHFRTSIAQNFVETVRIKYNDNPFHNFYHGFHAFQSVHLLLKAQTCVELFTPIDVFAMLVAALCHGMCKFCFYVFIYSVIHIFILNYSY